ncbi:putative hydroxyisocaproate [Phaeomoniella chlamydospora]|uniref:Putative hydroxyisocaproate n=1 Tax=Phaeomoniella chlamydospora TaxID=158046 RepID=A0A0G2E3X8_PHACM|nr:putative hydroxyisocaproate [Phaeomoniella chlamydospora]
MSKPAVLLLPPLVHIRAEWEALASKATLKVSIIQADLTAKYICHNGAGYNTIDAQACNERGIIISNTPTAVDDATADIGILLMLGALRSLFVPLGKLMGEGGWERPIGHDPKGKALGILGMGGIGRAMAKRARAFGMKIIYHNRNRLSPDLEGDAEYVNFDDLLSKADVLSLNLALNEKTKHIIGAAELEKMKDGVVIVNTARGALIDESALVKALDSKKVASVGLDVFEQEPNPNPELLRHKHCVFLPHIGTNTWETQKQMELLVLKNIESALDTGKVITCITETPQEDAKL